MNENDLSDLSYKELQALAVRYRVPGNIKKHLLVRVLQAIQNGNEQEVNRTLTEVQLTRKKRIKKQKPNAMNLSSTPIHSPNYGFSHDCYYPRHQQPYQWVGAQEEISMREEETMRETMRVPNYQEFRQFLLHRIQRDYPTYNSRENDLTHSSSIVDLRMGAGTSSLQPVIAEPSNLKSEMLVDPNDYVRPSSRSVDLQLLTDVNDNNEGPMLLKKMLEAPMGANLGQIASPDPGSHKIWPLEQYPNNNGDLDDSDTLTADSDIENDDTWDNSNNKIGNYYGTPMYNNDSNIASRNIQNTGQIRYPAGNTDQQYQHGYSVANVESSCQKWIVANSLASRNGNYVEPITGNPRGYNSIYYENTAENNSTITRPIDRDRKYYYSDTGNEHLNYGGNQPIHHGQHANWSQEVHQYYEGNRADAHSGDLYYSQQGNIKHSVGAINQEYYANQGLSQNVSQNNPCHEIAHPEVPPQICGNVYNKDNAGAFNHNGPDNATAYNTGYYSQYSHENTQQLNDFSNPVNPNKLQQTQQTSGIVHESNSRDDKVESSTTQQQSFTSGILDSYCPRLPMNATITSNGQLETILNLNNRVNTDYSKINETSCVYCYSEPIVTQRIEGMHTWCSLKKPPIAEGRQHIFSPNWVVYNDASTGMIMANNEEEPSIIDLDTPMSLERSNGGPSISSPDHDSEPRASTESSDGSINDVWIHDYTSYPVSSDNALQSAELTNDETDDDLFSTVSRAAPQNSIDDHTIESFTDLNY